MRIRFALGTRTRAWARTVRPSGPAPRSIVVCDHGAEVGVHFRDRVRSVRRGHHVERAAEDAPEAAKDERVVVDEQDTLARRARAARRGWDHPAATRADERAPSSSHDDVRTRGVRKRRSIGRFAPGTAAGMDWMQQRLVEAQGIGWKIAIVRAVHGAHADGWSIDELIAEHDRMDQTVLMLRHMDGRTETMSELRLRLEFDRGG